MGIEGTPRNARPPEDEIRQEHTPASLTAYVEANAALPQLSREDLDKLNDVMTQAEINAYHSVLTRIDDDAKRQVLLDTWIPRPKVLYHASISGDVQEFEPRGRYKRRPEDPPQVFGATSEAVAAMMLAPGGDDMSKSGSYDGGRTWTLIYSDTNEFRQADTGGYIYELPPDDFTVDPYVGLGLAEWTSTKAVKPVGRPKHYSSAVEAMRQHGVKVYRVDAETLSRFRDDQEDQIEVLKKLSPLT